MLVQHGRGVSAYWCAKFGQLAYEHLLVDALRRPATTSVGVSVAILFLSWDNRYYHWVVRPILKGRMRHR
jgi:hypothetical protein